MKILNLKIRNNYIVLEKNILLIDLFAIMPIVDSVSGAMHDRIPLGQIYRLLIFVFMFVLLSNNSLKKFSQVFITFVIFLTIQSIVSIEYIGKSIQDVIKLFTPIISIVLIETLLKKKKVSDKNIFDLLDVWCILYPILIIVPSILGLGVSSYEGTIGFKGFFYAVNEISFVMCSLIMYSFWKLQKDADLKSFIVLAINCLCIITMGTKTAYATIVLFTLVFLISFIKNRSIKRRLKIMLFIAAAIIVILFNYKRIIEMTSAIFERWYYQRKMSYSLSDFLFSMRLRRIENAWDIFWTKLYFAFGWGFGGELVGFPNIEMDFLDVLFRSGIFGFIYIFLFYMKKTLYFLRKNSWSLIITLWSLALSFGTGHVLFYGQSGMMLSINFTLAYIISKSNEKENWKERVSGRESNSINECL